MMREGVPASTEEPMAEAIATTGLFLNITAVIAIAVCLASWGTSDGTLALVAGVIAIASFGTSIVCFVAQAKDRGADRIRVG